VKFPVLVSPVDILPAIVEYNIIVAQIPQPQTKDLLRSGVKKIFRDIAAESVPVVLLSLEPHPASFARLLKGQRTHPIGGVTASPLLTAAAPLKRVVAIAILLRTVVIVMISEGSRLL
jgi:hypothetical protein